MFCPACGTESTQAINYCKRCGAVLNAATRPEPQSVPLKLTGMFLLLIGLVTTLGLAMPLVAVSELAGKGLSTDILKNFIVLAPITTLAVDLLLVWLLLHLIKISSPHSASHRLEGEIVPRAQPMLPPHPEAVSATENTTRNFEPLPYRDIPKE